MTRPIPRTRRVERQHAEETVAHLKKVGVRNLQVLAARDGRDCPVCLALDGAVFSVDTPPKLPPKGCTCRPYGCRLVICAWRKSSR